MISETQLEPVIDAIDRDPELDHQLKLLDALSHLPLSPTGWRSVSVFVNELLERSLARDDACIDALPLFARIPLASVRRRLRDIATGPNRTLAMAAAIALAEQGDPASLSPLLSELQHEPSERIAAAIAWSAPQQLRTSATPLAAFLAQPDPIVRMWIAIALAKAHEPGRATGDLEPLEQLWDALVRPPEFFSSLGREPLFEAPPEIFHGDPSMAAALLAKARPLPAHVEAFLVGLKNADFEDDWNPRSSLVASAREAKILLAGLTAQFDVDGTPIDAEPATATWPPADEHRATLAVDVLSHAPWQGLDLNLSEEQRRHLRAAPPDTAAQVVEQAIQRLPAEAQTLGNVPAWMLGNSLLRLATSLPSSLPLRIASILADQVIATKISRPALAWTLARAGADVVWKELAPHITSKEGVQRRQWLDWLASISAQLNAPAPYAGAGGAEPTESRVSDLVDDLPKTSALPPAALESMPAGPRPRAPAPATATGSRPTEQSRSTPGARYVQGDLYKKQDQQWIESGADLTRGALYRLDVFVAPSGAGQFQAQTPFPDDALKWQSAKTLRLQVVLAILDGRQDAYVEHLLLPREGASSRCEFQFSIERFGRVRLRIAIMYEGRVLQTSTLDVNVHEKDIVAAQEAIHPQTEMVVHPDLTTVSTLRRFDASLVLNETPTGESAMTVAGRKGAYISSLDNAKKALASISNLLQVIANNSKLHTKKLRSLENAQWLGELANEGHWLYRELFDYVERSPVAAQLREAKYLQIVAARPDAVVPLEFVYEYPAPDDSEGPIEICDRAEEALASGACPVDCAHKQQPHKFVCPMGFWGLSRVIERHVHDPTLKTEAIVTADDNLASRKRLVLEGPSLLAASKQVPSDRVNELSTRLQQSWRRGVKRVNDWNEWLDAVKSEPALFVVLPHAHGEGTAISLEINGHSIRSSRIERKYVYPESSKASPPIVLLLGCNTAGVADMNSYARHITVFRQAQSAIVLATTAAVVWGADIAQVAEELIEQLRVAAESSEDCFGEVLRDAKRRAVLKSQLVAICLAAVGDADWRLDIPQDAP